MYKLVSSASYLIRFWLAYITIENVSIFKNELINYFWGEVFSVYILLMIIAYFIVGRWYRSGDNPTLGALMYFVIYCGILFVYWIILLILTWIGILPIG